LGSFDLRHLSNFLWLEPSVETSAFGNLRTVPVLSDSNEVIMGANIVQHSLRLGNGMTNLAAAENASRDCNC